MATSIKTLDALLQDGIQFSPNYQPDGNSDHLPMTLAAIQGLGGTDQNLLDFKSAYQTRLHQWPESAPIADWREGLGRPELYGSLLKVFTQSIEQEGELSVLNSTLPDLLPGIALDAFHPIIRLGFARDFGNQQEVVAALAYMVIAFQPMPRGLSPISLRDELQQQVSDGPVALKSARFGGAILELAANGTYPLGCADTLETVASTALDIYQSTRNFFALHLVTATQAVRCAVPESMHIQGLAAMTRALLASHIVLGSPEINSAVLPAPQRLDPEHSFKYCWACLSEYRTYGDERYLQEIHRFVEASLVPGWVIESIKA